MTDTASNENPGRGEETVARTLKTQKTSVKVSFCEQYSYALLTGGPLMGDPKWQGLKQVVQQSACDGAIDVFVLRVLGLDARPGLGDLVCPGVGNLFDERN